MGWLSGLLLRLNGKRDASCCFCAGSYMDVRPLVEGPRDAFICSSCCEELSSQFTGSTDGRCSFCRRRSSQVGLLSETANDVLICTHCVDFAKQVLEMECQRRG